MPLVITSFRRIKFIKSYLNISPEFYSVARWQPKGFKLPELPFLAPPPGLDVDIASIDSIKRYETGLREAYTKRWPEIKSWLDGLDNNELTGIVCWCPYRRSNSFGSFICHTGPFACHTGLIGRMVNKHRPDIDIWLDRAHLRLIPEWRPEYSQVLNFRWKQRKLFNMEITHASQAV